ncbi:uncharacterized protein LOC143181263 [Calliopsis andreniformis]|uniref:uncharacterized protein LOC143181263 n=1 Tax=Calliopsis andreniformis TaxID=337506 RepID=UPI003FCE9357
MGRKKCRGKNGTALRRKTSRTDCTDRTDKKIDQKESHEEVVNNDVDDDRNNYENDNNDDDKNEIRKERNLLRRYGMADVPTCVLSRLAYPFVQTSENGSISSDESDGEEERVELNIRPRFVFVSSLCAVCLTKSRMVCERCQMVSYCSVTHRVQGSYDHRDLCEALMEIRSLIARSLSEKSNEYLDAVQYRIYRLRLLQIFESKIGRPLKLWEKEIVLYPRVCRICRCFRESPISCSHCAMEYFCENHAIEHGKWCREFQVLQRCLFLQYKHGCASPRIPNVREQVFVASPDLDFDRLMHRIYRNSLYYREMDCYTYAMLSHLCTIPLTALYSMQISCPDWRSKTDWTIHILGAEFQFEGVNLRVWEKLFLHFLPNLKRLRLILIGPELCLPTGVPAKLLSKVQLCSHCKSTNKTITVLFRPGKLYHECVRQEPKLALETDLICLYNPGLYRETGFAGEDSWLKTIQEFCKLTAPVVITSYTVDEIGWEINRVTSVSDVKVLLEPRRNPFASVKPDRNFVSDDSNPLIYKNYYITIVQAKSTLS